MARVLFIDDDLGLHHVMQALLRLAGHEGVCVPSGEAALEYLRSTIPDVVLLDLMMPGLSGIDVLNALRGDPRMAGLPIIMFSGVSDEKEIQRCLASGANDYWVKGNFDFDQLKARLDRYIPPA